MGALISFEDPAEVLPKQIKYYTHALGMGICTSITGSPTQKCGCGKSITSLGVAAVSDEHFDIDKIGLSPHDFLMGIDSFNKHTWGDKVLPGQAVVMDEGEVAAPSSLWFSFTNRAIFYTLATFRELNGIAIIATPSLKWIDSRMRTLMTFWGYCNKELYGTGQRKVELKMYRVSTDLFGEQFFFRKIRMWDRANRRVAIFKSFNVKMPDPELVAQYEEKSRKFKAGLRRDLVADVEKFNKLSSYNSESKGESLEQMAKTLADDVKFRNTLLGDRKGTKAFSTPLLRAVLEQRDIFIKQGQAEHLKKMLLEEWFRKKADDV